MRMEGGGRTKPEGIDVADADWKKIQDLFDQEHKWMLAKMQEHIREVNGMFAEERRRVQKRYK
ncbi:MAG: hypothetical protein II766_02550, partial [Paludibacteraceae bacterium]|nr:hypothetical protein [Paludibacteraceae bacterium]